MAKFKDRLKELRKEKDFTQAELGEILNCSDTAIMRYEKGQRQLQILTTIINLAKFFNVTTDYLLGLTEERNHINVRLSIEEASTDELLDEINRRWRT